VCLFTPRRPGDHAALQRPRAGREAVHPDPDAAEERAVAPELAEEAQLHAAQQLHTQERGQRPAAQQLGARRRRAQSPVLHAERRGPERQRRGLKRGPAPPGGLRV